MRVLSVTAQKPCSTGSGVYLTEVVRSLAKMGVSQAVVAGVTREDRVDMPEGVTVYPVYFSSEKLPYPVVGMSDEMPYTSTRYRDMTEEMTVIGTGYNSEVFKKTGIKLSRKDGKIRMIFAGKITQKKGVKSLLRALNLLDYEKEKIQLILAGGAGNLVEYEEIKELADGCRYPVVFAGCVTQSRLAELYNDCDIFVLPSMYEGLPLTVIESLACGDRVVMTKLEGIAEWLADMVPDADIRYVLPPGMKGTDEPLEEELPAFESRLTEALREAIEEKDTKECDVSRISWQKIAREVIR